MRSALLQRFQWPTVQEQLGQRIELCSRVRPQHSVGPREALAGILSTTRFRGIPELATADMRWGLRPRWAQVPLMHAQAEKYTGERPTWWSEFRRCVVPVSSICLWSEPAENKLRRICSPGGLPLYLAALYRLGDLGPGLGYGKLCVLLSAPANRQLRPYQHRQAVLLQPHQVPTFLDRDADRRDFAKLLVTPGSDRICVLADGGAPGSELLEGRPGRPEPRQPRSGAQVALFA